VAPPKRSRLFRVVRAVVVLAVLLTAWHFIRPSLRPAVPGPDEATKQHLQNVKILRDTWGVPHIFGKSDADTAFGLAYAHCEDDFKTIQAVMAATRGQLGLVLFDTKAPVLDYYTNLVRAEVQARRDYDKLSPQTRALVEGYARGLTYYAYKHPKEADGRLYPILGQDLVAGFVHKLSIMVGLPGVLEKLNKGEAKKEGDPLTVTTGSNAQAVHRTRSTDDVTRLNINSHQPWEGPVSWYEAQVVSEEGWNMTGGTFPSGPLMLHGHNESLGWALTVNGPDVVDVFELHTDAAHPGAYELDGEWVKFEEEDAPLTFDTGLFDATFHKKVFWSQHGPALELDGKWWAIRYAAMERGAFAVEEWYRMNKAKTHAEWLDALAVHAIPMFHMVYADRDNVGYVYNAKLPLRSEGYDYSRVLPGNKKAAIWNGYLPFDQLPRVTNPPSGFVQGCNSTPWVCTTGEGNPKPEAFAATLGIEQTVTNRTQRSLALLGGEEKLDAAAFERMKWDRGYDKESNIFKQAVNPLLLLRPATDDEKTALNLLHGWDGTTDEKSAAATIATMVFKSVSKDARAPGDPKLEDPAQALRETLAWLKQNFGRVDVPLGEVQRLHRGTVDLPLGGGPDNLNAVYSRREKGKLVGFQGDSYVLMVEFGPNGVSSKSIHNYGSATGRPESKHYADQAPLFVERKLKPVWRTKEEIRAHLEREYTPGE
jgi:acyl-homoserine-lactone acylase